MGDRSDAEAVADPAGEAAAAGPEAADAAGAPAEVVSGSVKWKSGLWKRSVQLTRCKSC